MAVCGALLLSMALASAWIRRLPITTSMVYMAVGLGLGPLGAGWLRVDALELAPFLERATEIAVILSLFVGGLKLRLPLLHACWRAAYRLAGPVMLLCIAAVAAFVRLALGLDLWVALLVGAVLAPTDPVLASALTVSDAADRDRLRYGLSGEAGLTDGMAFPFVVFALAWAKEGGAGAWVGGWALHRLVYAVPAGLALGFLLGLGLGRLAIALRSRQRDRHSPSDFLALALIAISYVLAEWVGAWGFLSTFAAGVGLRRAEIAAERHAPEPRTSDSAIDAGAAKEPAHPPAETMLEAKVGERELEEPAVAAGILVAETISFGDTAERLLEVLLVVVVGAALALHWDPRGLALAFVLYFVARPAATLASLLGTPTTLLQRALLGWFGIRGVGSLYYLAYALNHGATGPGARQACDLAITAVAGSILLHGVTAQPALDAYERRLRRAPAEA